MPALVMQTKHLFPLFHVQGFPVFQYCEAATWTVFIPEVGIVTDAIPQ